MTKAITTRAADTALATTPDPRLAKIVDMVIDSLQSPHTQRAYRNDLSSFMGWYAETGQTGFTKAVANAYRTHLREIGKSDIVVNRALSAVRKLAREAGDNGLIDERDVASFVKVEGIQRRGNPAGNWLTREEAERLINSTDRRTVKGMRDRAILAVLIGTGLRRNECANLHFKHVQQREGRWCIIDLVGKRNKMRTIMMPSWVKSAIDAYATAAGVTDGHVFRPMLKGNHVAQGDRVTKNAHVVSSDKLTAQAIRNVVAETTAAIGITAAAHDLRRTYAKLARSGGADLEQVQLSLGHDSLDTTKRYLGSELNYQKGPGDFIDITLSSGK